tara:strand:- start:565 stop:1059 length:495 start_codon:yes stop_codon:yes gene_type:complete
MLNRLSFKGTNGFYLILLMLSSMANSECEFDADAIDQSDFVSQIGLCEQSDKDNPLNQAKKTPISLFGEGVLDSSSGIIERNIRTPNAIRHTPNQAYIARRKYSLRSDAKFEQSVNLAIHRLHLDMAHNCSRGWRLETQWSEMIQSQEGDYYLHYQFRCSDIKQ